MVGVRDGTRKASILDKIKEITRKIINKSDKEDVSKPYVHLEELFKHELIEIHGSVFMIIGLEEDGFRTQYIGQKDEDDEIGWLLT